MLFRYLLLGLLSVVAGILVITIGMSFLYVEQDGISREQQRMRVNLSLLHPGHQEWFQVLEVFQNFVNSAVSSNVIQYYQDLMKECATGVVEASAGFSDAPYLRMVCNIF